MIFLISGTGQVATLPGLTLEPSLMRNPYALVLFGIASLFSLRSAAQCTNGALYPENSVVPNAAGVVTEITGCSYQTEYSHITGLVAGTGYVFTIVDASHITVRQGVSNGPVLAFGYSPLTVVTTSADDLFVHWNTNAACGTATACLATTVQRLIDCVPPSVTATTINDCLNGEFSVNVDIADAGDANSLSYAWTVDGGNLSVQGGVAEGSYQLGPFALGALIDLTVVHGDNSDCNVDLLNITDSSCVILGCGPDTYTYCYGNDADYERTYQSTSAFPVRIQFNSGGVSATGNDELVIHDGLSEYDPVLFSGVGNAGDLTGVTAISTNPDHALTIKFTSNSSFGCADGGVSPEWNYTVSCLDCIPVSGSVDSVTTDCEAQEFTVDVIISELGSDAEVEIANDAGVASVFADAPGTYTAGPFPLGTPVGITLVNDQDSLCTVDLGTFENGFCPTDIDCDAPLFEDTYCYADFDIKQWLYLRQGTGALVIDFTSGSIESSAYDHLIFRDGVDNTAPILWQHTSGNFDLAGLQVVSTGPALFVEMTADYSVSCGAGSFVPWVWTVGCLDCTGPSAAFDVVADCLHHTYSVEVEVTGLGSGTDVLITDTWSGDTLNAGLGTSVIGPIPVGTQANVSVMNGQNTACRVTSPPLNYSAENCVQVACETVSAEHCYADADTSWFVYTSGNTIPVTITFLAGQLLDNDNVMLYNGLDTDAQLVFAGNLGGDVSGLALSSSNPDNALTLLVTSDGSGSCASGDASPTLQWTVGCGLVGMLEPGAIDPVLFPQPCDQVLNVRWPAGSGIPVVLELIDITGRSVMREGTQTLRGGTHVLDVGHLRAGGYVLRLVSLSGAFSAPVLIER